MLWPRYCLFSLLSCFPLHIVYIFLYKYFSFFFFFWRNSPQWVMASSFTRILDPTQRRTTGGRTPKDEWSARRRDPFWQHTTLTTDIYSLGVIRTHSLTRRAAADPRLRPRGHWDRQLNGIKIIKIVRNKSSERRNISWRNCIIATNLLRSSNN